MKISFVRLENTAFGGAENYLQRVCQTLSQQQIEYEVVYGKMPKFLASWIKALWFSYQVKRNKGSKFYFSLARITSPDIYRAGDGVHRAYMKAMNLKFWHNPMHITACYLEKRVFQNAKVIIANSEMVKREIMDCYQIPADKITVIYNGVPSPQVYDKQAAKLALCHELQLANDKPIILFVGSGMKRKGGDIFLRIIAKLQQDYSAIIVGKDKRIAEYKQLAQQLGITDRVKFVGQRRDIDKFYAASDIFLFPPRYEPFSNVVLEAMSYGNVVFTSQHNGAAEILSDDYVIRDEQDSVVVEKIDSLLRSPEKLIAAQSDNVARAKAFTIEVNVEKTLAVIHRFLA